MRKNVTNIVLNKGLELLEKIAEKKANSECYGILYEPKVPKKLKKTLCLTLACMLTAVTVLAGGPTKYQAAEHTYKDWQTIMGSPASSTYVTSVSLYITTEPYQWAVTSYSVPNSYGKVTLNGYNCFTTILNGGRELSSVGSRNFTIYMDMTAGYAYAQFKVTMDYDGYPSWFKGYIKIL